jgi:hypothetical protein
MVYPWDNEEVLRASVIGAHSMADVMRNLKVPVNNGKYRALKKYFNAYNIPLPKGTGKGKIIGGVSFEKMPDEKFFSIGVLHNGQAIKKRLIEDYGWEDKCAIDGQLPWWNGKPLVLQLDHINGDRFDNRLENLRILCPHCHTQTETYANNGGQKRYNYCPECGTRISKQAKACVKHAENKSHLGNFKIDWPSQEEIISLVKEMGYLQAGLKLGVSDNAIRRHLTSRGVDVNLVKKEK